MEAPVQTVLVGDGAKRWEAFRLCGVGVGRGRTEKEARADLARLEEADREKDIRIVDE